MTHTVTIQLPDEVYQALLRWAQEQGETPEALAGQYLTDLVLRMVNDPLLRHAGSITSDITDVSLRHDEYIGQALFKELRGCSDE